MGNSLKETINQAINDLHNIKQALQDKGVTIPPCTPYSEYDRYIEKLGKPWEPETFELCTGDEFQQILSMHYNNQLNISDYWHIGDEKIITLNAVNNYMENNGSYNYPECIMPIRIIGFDHDDLVTPINEHTKAAVTFESKMFIGYYSGGPLTSSEWASIWQTSAVYDDMVYKDSPRREWFNTVFPTALPEYFQNNIKLVYKPEKTTHIGNEVANIEELIFLLSNAEIIKNGDGNEGSQYAFYELYPEQYIKAAALAPDYDSRTYARWTRTPSPNKYMPATPQPYLWTLISPNTSTFKYTIGASIASYGYAGGLPFAFCC